MISLNKRELTAIMINLMTVKLLLTYPREMVITAGPAAWLESIFVTTAALCFYIVTYKLYLTNKSILTLSREIGGRPLKTAVGAVVSVLLLVNMALTMRAFPESVRIALLQNTSMQLIVILLTAAVVIGANNGLEALSRIEVLFLPIMGVIMLIFLLMVIPFMHPTNITPIFGNGAGAIIGRGFRFVSAFADILALNFLMPLCSDKETAFKSGILAIIISGAVMTIIHAAYGLTYPYPISHEFIMPVYQLTRIIKIGDFLARFDAFFEFVWIIAMLLYAAVYVSVICLIWRDTFELKYEKPLIMPVSISAAVISFIPASIVELMDVYMKFLNIFYPAAFLIPLIIGLLHRFKTGERRNKA